MQYNMSQRKHCETFCFLEILGNISMPESLTTQESTCVSRVDSPCLSTKHLCLVSWKTWLKTACLSTGSTDTWGNITCGVLWGRTGVVSIFLEPQFPWSQVDFCKTPQKQIESSLSHCILPLPVFSSPPLHLHARIGKTSAYRDSYVFTDFLKRSDKTSGPSHSKIRIMEVTEIRT